jgi:hypothetical protein
MFRHKGFEVRKGLLSRGEGGCELIEQNCRIRSVTLPRRSEVIVKLPLAVGTFTVETLLERKGIYGRILEQVVDGHVLTSMLNTREDEIEMEPVAELKKI